MAIIESEIRQDGAGDYTSIAAWLTSVPADLAGDIYKGTITDANDYNESDLEFGDRTTNDSTTSYIWLDVDPAVRHSGVPASASGQHARISSSGSPGLIEITATNDTQVRITGLELHLDGTANTSDEAIRVYGSGLTTIVASKCIFSTNETGLSAGSSTNDLDGIYIYQTPFLVYVDNCVFTGFSRAALHTPQGYSNNFSGLTGTLYVDHCSFWNNGEAAETEGANINIRLDSVPASPVEIYSYNNVWPETSDGLDPVGSSGSNDTANVDWYGSHNVVTVPTPVRGGSDDFMTNYIEAIDGTTDTDPTTGDWLNLENLVEQTPNLTPVDVTGMQILGLGTNRQGSEPDSRQDFSTDITGSARGTTDVDPGAFQVTPVSGGDTPVAGSAGSVSNTAQAGTVVVDAVQEGVQSTTTDSAQAGTVEITETVQGAQSTLTDSPQAGNVSVDIVVEGNQVAASDTAQAGQPFTATTVAGAQATTTDTPQQGSTAETITGSQASATDAASTGSIDVVVAGSQATATDEPQAGTVPSTLVLDTKFDEGSLPAGWTFEQNSAANASINHLNDFATITIPAGTTSDSISSTSSPDNTAGLVHELTTGVDFDVAVRIGSTRNDDGSTMYGFVLRESASGGARMIRWTPYAVAANYNKYGYERYDGAGNNFQSPSALTSNSPGSSSLGGSPGWVRVVRTGTLYEFFYSYNGFTWYAGSSVTSNVDPDELKLVVGQYGDTEGQPFSYDEVVDLVTAGGTDARGTEPVVPARNTIESVSDFTSGLPAWLNLESAVNGSAVVNGAVVELSTAAADGSYGWLTFNGVGEASNSGVLIKAKASVTDAAAYAAIGLGHDSTPAIDQYSKAPAWAYEAQMSGNATNNQPLRVHRPHDAPNQGTLNEAYSFLVPEVGWSATDGDLWCFRVEEWQGWIFMRAWRDIDTEPSTWDFAAPERTLSQEGNRVPYVGISHNDGSPATSTLEVHEVEFYETAATAAVNVPGSQSSAVDAAQAGSAFVEATASGLQSSETNVANAGQVVVDIVVSGNQATTTSVANTGEANVGSVVSGGQVTAVDSPQSGTTSEILTGTQATTTDVANAGSPNVGTIVEGAQGNLTDTAQAGAGIVDAIVEGTQSSVTDNPVTGNAFVEIVVQGQQATTTDNAQAGAADTTELVAGSSAATTDAANAGQAIVDAVIEGAQEAASDAAQAGQVVGQDSVVGITANVTDAAVGGSVAIVQPGASASSTDAAQTGSTDVSQTGSQDTTTDTPQSGYLAADIEGQQVTTSDAASAGSTFVEVVVQGNQATITDTAGDGAPVSAGGVPGEQAQTTDTAQAGSIDVDINGSQATTTDTAQAGFADLGVTVEGTQATTTDNPAAGQTDVQAVVEGQQASTTDTAVGGDNSTDIVQDGSQASASDSAVSGQVIIDIVVEGTQIQVTDDGQVGETPVDAVIEGNQASVIDEAQIGEATSGAVGSGAQVSTVDTPVAGSSFVEAIIIGSQVSETAAAQVGEAFGGGTAPTVTSSSKGRSTRSSSGKSRMSVLSSSKT